MATYKKVFPISFYPWKSNPPIDLASERMRLKISRDVNYNNFSIYVLKLVCCWTMQLHIMKLSFEQSAAEFLATQLHLALISSMGVPRHDAPP